ncbi:MAG: diaminopimelate epimerase [Pseudomonadota bacterium]
MAGLAFRKMHGAGNDFVVIDARGGTDPITASRARAIADRHRGVGFDQIAVILDDAEAAARLVFWNADGSQADACGNATRCIADLLMAETGRAALTLRTGYGLLAAERRAGGAVWVNMGPPSLDWADVPLAEAHDTVALPIEGAPGALSMGNPHCAFIVEDAEAVDLARFGPAHETHPLFPARTNVEVVEVRGPERLRVRIWERGAGITLASGSCVSAAVVAATRKGLIAGCARVEADGGVLEVDWRDDGVWQTGPVAYVFEGVIAADWLAAADPGAAA